MAVVAPAGVVGHVIDSWHGGAKVRVLTDPESAIAVRTLERSGDRYRAGPAAAVVRSSVSDFDATANVKRGRRRGHRRSSPTACSRPISPVGTVTSVDKQARRSRTRRARSSRPSTSTRSSSSRCCAGCRARAGRPIAAPRPPRRHHHHDDCRRLHSTPTLDRADVDDHDDRVALMRVSRVAALLVADGRRCRSRCSRTFASPDAFPISGSSSRSPSRSTTDPRPARSSGFSPVSVSTSSSRRRSVSSALGVRAHCILRSVCCRAACCGRRGGSRR